MRLIDADALLKEVENEQKYLIARGQLSEEHILVHALKRPILDAPTVDAVAQKKGKWILTEDDNYEYCTCSECGYQNGENWMIGSDIPFCAMCGADMRGETDEAD